MRLGPCLAVATPGSVAADWVPERRAIRSVTRPGNPLAILEGPALSIPAGAPATLTDALLRSAAGDRGTTYVLADGSEERQTYRALLEDAVCLLPGLRAIGLQPGDSVLLHCDDNRAFITGFWACVLGGFVPTPIGVAPSYREENAVTRRMRGAWELLDRPPLLTNGRLSGDVAQLSELWGGEPLVVLTAEDLRTDEGPVDLYPADPEHPVLHLLTSGTTGVPKCVRHCHRTVVTRAFINAAANGFGRGDVTLNFMPLDHVAGMAMHNLRDVILPCDHVNARIEDFLADPLRWFTWIERHRVTNTSAPNFVITLVTGLEEEIAQRHWDLSSLRDITNGGEAIVSSTTHRFLHMLAPHGLRPDVMRPAWGMSEFCGGVVHSTLRSDDESVGVVTVEQWADDGSLAVLPGPAPGYPTFTEVGVPAPGTSVRIVDRSDVVGPEDHIGRLQVRGPTLMVGYHRNAEATAKVTTADGWFDTGDLGFVHDGRLVMTGREKDIIVIRSANYPCHEIEAVVGGVNGVVPTLVAACGDRQAETGTDELVLFCVFESDDPHVRRDVVREITRRVGAEIGIAPRRIVPVAREAFPRTSAGKIERQRLLADLHAGVLGDGSDVDSASAGSGGAWLYRTIWTQAPAVPGPLPIGPWLVFDDGGVAERLRAHAPNPIIGVRPGLSWGRQSDAEYRIDPADPRQYQHLLAAVRADHGEVAAVVHAWATAPVENASVGVERSTLSLHRVLKAFGTRLPRTIVVTAGACPVNEHDPVEPLNATVSGLVRTANAEYGTAVIRQLDIRPGDADWAPLTLAELADAGDDDIVASRSGGRLVPRIRPCQQLRSEPAHRIHRGGLYLLTGGLGTLGSHIGEFLLTRYGATLIIYGRSAATGERAERLSRLEALGDVTYLRGDVADAEALRADVEAMEQRAGRTLDGAIHLAGADIRGTWDDLDAHLLRNENTSEFRRMYHAKVHGTLALAAVLDERPDALLVVASSVNGYFGGAAFGAYSSASSFLSAFVEHRRRQGRAAQCHSWSLWVDDRTSAAQRAAVELHGFRPIDADRGGLLFEAALADPASQVLIGLDDAMPAVAREVDPAAVLEQGLVVVYSGASVEPTAVRDAVAAALGPGAPSVQAEPTASRVPEDQAAAAGDSLYEPLNELMAAIVAVWHVTLARKIGPDDHFFDLGGDSLLAIRLVDRLNAHLGDDLSVHDIYEFPTVRALARELTARRRATTA